MLGLEYKEKFPDLGNRYLRKTKRKFYYVHISSVTVLGYRVSIDTLVVEHCVGSIERSL